MLQDLCHPDLCTCQHFLICLPRNQLIILIPTILKSCPCSFIKPVIKCNHYTLYFFLLMASVDMEEVLLNLFLTYEIKDTLSTTSKSMGSFGFLSFNYFIIFLFWGTLFPISLLILFITSCDFVRSL